MIHSDSDQTSDATYDIAQLYTLFQRPIIAYLTRLVGERETAEDLYQETFLKVMRHWASQRDVDRRSSWLYRIATNTAYDYLRRYKRVRFLTLDAVEESADEQTGIDTLCIVSTLTQHALEQIPPHYRVPLLLYMYGGYSTDQIASALGCSNLAVRLRVSRARTRFKQVYGQ